MIKQEIIEKISKYFRLTEYEAERVYDDIFSVIMTGVKEDNVVDVSNLGEFIIKRETGEIWSETSASGYEKNVEFLPSSIIEDELNKGVTSMELRYSEPPLKSEKEQVEIEQPEIRQPEIKEHEIEEPEIKEPEIKEPEIKEPEIKEPEIKEPEIKEPEIKEPEILQPLSEAPSGASIEEELRRKREDILSKLTGPILPVTPQIVGEDIKQQGEKQQPAEQMSEQAGEEPVQTENKEHVYTEESASGEKMEKTDEIGEDLSHKSFSDYFSEVSRAGKTTAEEKPVESVKESVIPQKAVLLHNEIIGAAPAAYTAPEEKEQIVQTAEEETAEHRAIDNSYYIWYKDSESNPIDTQTLSYEYELLYQATKEAEYKSKLKIYVTTFILFFSLVLALLIFSPILYKMFFSPGEYDIPGIENRQEESPDISQQKAVPNVIQDNNNIQTRQVDSTNPGITRQTGAEQNQQTSPVTKENNASQQIENAGLQQQQQTQPKVETTLEGVTKNAVGWVDSKNNVIYILLENGKYAIQESSWNSEGKANARISMIESLGIKDLKGSVAKTELGNKGTWFRVRLGEFSTLEEARKKAEELQTKRAGRF
jgi:hypothetical protein